MPRTEKQNARIRNKRKQKILSESLHLFARKRYKAVSIDDIAKEVGCTHSLIYHYFPSKEDVYREVLMLAKENLQGLVDPSVTIDISSPKEILETILVRIHDGLISSKRVDVACSLILILDIVFDDDEIAEEIMPRHKRPFSMISRIIEEGQLRDEFYAGDPKEYTVIINSFLRGVSIASLQIKKDKLIIPDPSYIMRMLVKEEN